MAKIGKRAPTPQPTIGRISPLKPSLRGARNWATAQMRAASYSRAGFIRMTISLCVLLISILLIGLWLGGFLPKVSQGMSNMTKSRLVAMGFHVQNIDVIGEGRIREDEVLDALGIEKGQYIFDIDMREAQLRVQSLSWIDDAIIRRLWPDSIVVHIVERQPVALWQNDYEVKVIDAKSVIIEDANASDFAHLPMIVGPNAAAQSQQLYDALVHAPSIMAHVKAIIYVGERRWDIALKDNRPRLMLPQDGAISALAYIENLHQAYNILDRDIGVIDLRVEGRLVLHPVPSSGQAGKRGAA